MALTQISTGGIKDDAVTDAKLPANSVGNSEMKDDAVGVAELSATGTASSSTFLRGDNSWVTPTDTNTQLAFANDANNRVVTGDGSGGLNGEANLTFDGSTLVIPTVAGANTNSALNILFQTSSGAIDGGSGLTYNPGGDTLSVNGNSISNQTFRGSGSLAQYNCANHSSTTGIEISNKLDLKTVDNTAGAFKLVEGSNEYITVDTTDSSEAIKFGTAGLERLRIRSDGKISCGTSINNTNDYELSLTGADGTGGFYAHGRNHYLSNRSDTYASVTLKKANADSDAIDYLQLRDSSNNIKAVITGAGNWKPISGGGIDFSATGDASGSSSELLDDYEEGTWTPGFVGTTTTDFTYSSNTGGSYVRIGSFVWAHGRIQLSANNGAGDLSVNGLPFTVANAQTGDSSWEGDLTTGAIDNAQAGTSGPTGVAYESGTQVDLWHSLSSGNGSKWNASEMDNDVTWSFSIFYRA